MKKGKYWFSKLSETEQQEFKENNANEDNNFDSIMNGEFKSFEEFIFLCGFSWIFSPQGDEYWINISNRDEL